MAVGEGLEMAKENSRPQTSNADQFMTERAGSIAVQFLRLEKMIRDAKSSPTGKEAAWKK